MEWLITALSWAEEGDSDQETAGGAKSSDRAALATALGLISVRLISPLWTLCLRVSLCVQVCRCARANRLAFTGFSPVRAASKGNLDEKMRRGSCGDRRV